MKAILHIGPPKTGSSYLQTVLDASSKALLKHGWEYPAVSRPHQPPDNRRFPDHRLLAYQADDYLLPGKPGRKELEQNVADARAAGRNMIFSAEGLVYWSRERFERFAEILGAEEIVILYFLRNPFQIFYSSWKEGVKHGLQETLPEFFLPHFADPSHSALINPALALLPIADLPAPYRLVMQSYDGLRASGTDLADHVWYDLMGISAPFSRRRKEVNTSLTIETSEFLRVLLGTYAERYPDRDVNQAMLSFLRLQRERGLAHETLRWLGMKEESSYGPRIEAVMEPLKPLKRTFTVPVDTGVHSYLRSQMVELFGHCMHPRMEQGEVLEFKPVAMEYYRTEDLRASDAVVELTEQMITAIGKELAFHYRGQEALAQ